jgi:ABC-type nitrate/sulfonate/bicarbonate transport system substrate-binding protein
MSRWAVALALSLFVVGCASSGAPAGSAKPAPAPASGAPSASAPAAPAASGGGAAAAVPPAIVVPPTQVRASFSVISGGIGAYWVAADAGLWKQHGLDVDLTFISGTPPGMAALIAGETQFAVASGDAVLRVQSQNPDVVSLVTTGVGNTHRLMATPGIRRLEDLRGRAIGVSAIGDGAYAIATKALLKLGYSPTSEFTWIATGGGSTAAMIAGLAAGAFDATPLTAPNDMVAERQGAHSVLDTADMNLPAAGLATNAMRRTLEQQRPVVEAFVAGVIDGVRVFREDPTLGKEILTKRMGMDDPEAIHWAWETYSGQRRAPKLYLDHAEMRAVLDDLVGEYPELQAVQLERVLDNSVLQELEAKGYFSSR